MYPWKKSTLLFNWELVKDQSRHGSILVSMPNCDYSIYYLYHSSVCLLECYVLVKNDSIDLFVGESPQDGDYLDYIAFENII